MLLGNLSKARLCAAESTGLDRKGGERIPTLRSTTERRTLREDSLVSDDSVIFHQCETCSVLIAPNLVELISKIIIVSLFVIFNSLIVVTREAGSNNVHNNLRSIVSQHERRGRTDQARWFSPVGRSHHHTPNHSALRSAEP